MKPLYLFAIIVITMFLSNSLFAQNTVTATLSGLSVSGFEKMIIARDKSSIICSSDPNGGGFSGFFISRINKDGNYLWTKTYYTTLNYKDYIRAIAPTDDNGFIFIANDYVTPTQSDGLLVIKCDSSGNIEWKKKITSKAIGYMYSGSITQTKDHGYYFSCLGKGLFLFKLNSLGSVEWNKVFSSPQYADYGISIAGITEAPGGGAMIAISETGCEAYCVWSYLFRFDKQGNFISGFEITIPGKESPILRTFISDEKTIHFLYTVNGIWNGNYACYMTYDTKTGKSKANLITNDIFSVKNFLQKEGISVLNNIGFSLGSYTSYSITNNGAIIKVEGGAFSNVTKFYKYDKEGRICPDYILPTFKDSSAERHINNYPLQLENSNEMYEFSDVDINVSSINDFAEVCSGVAPDNILFSSSFLNSKANNITHSFSVNISPNPSNSYALVQIHSSKQTNADISIARLDGKIVLKEKINLFVGANTRTISVSSFPKGMYIVKVSDGKLLRTIKLVKH